MHYGGGDKVMETLRLEHLKKYFSTPHGMLHAVDDVSLSIEEGKTLGVVGESGCGKSTLGRTVIHLLESTDGKIIFQGKDITHVSKHELRTLREDMQIIFQDPYSSLNPRMTVRQLIADPIKRATHCSRQELDKRVTDLMDMVGLPQRYYNAYPHEMDGGRRQRIVIARALSFDPKFIVCDEPVSALDVSIQAQILNLMKMVQKEQNLTYMFITHDLSVVRYMSDTICVMYLGQVVELAPAAELYKHPLHPYTKALLSSIPIPDVHRKSQQIPIKGEIVSPINPKPGCRFATRCDYACPECETAQQLCEVSPEHFVSCVKSQEIKI